MDEPGKPSRGIVGARLVLALLRPHSRPRPYDTRWIIWGWWRVDIWAVSPPPHGISDGASQIAALETYGANDGQDDAVEDGPGKERRGYGLDRGKRGLQVAEDASLLEDGV